MQMKSPIKHAEDRSRKPSRGVICRFVAVPEKNEKLWFVDTFEMCFDRLNARRRRRRQSERATKKTR